MLLLWSKRKEILLADLKNTLSPAQPKNFASIKDPQKTSLLLKNIKAYYEGLVVRITLRIASSLLDQMG